MLVFMTRESRKSPSAPYRAITETPSLLSICVPAVSSGQQQEYSRPFSAPARICKVSRPWDPSTHVKLTHTKSTLERHEQGSIHSKDSQVEYITESLIEELGCQTKLQELWLGRVTSVPEGAEYTFWDMTKEQLETGREQVSQLLATLSTLPWIRRLEFQGLLEAMVDADVDIEDAKQNWKHIIESSFVSIMETTTVLDIHLLCKSITQTLTTEDVRHCMLVCRNWHVVFGPYLLQTITIRKWSSIDTFMSLRVQELFNRYAANVRSIHSSSDNIWPTLLSVPLKNLTVLGIHSIDLGKRYRQSDQNQTSLLLSFFRSSPKIEVLKLGFFEAEQVQDVLSAVLGLQYLRKLSIQNTDPTDCHTVRRFLLSCYGLEKVHVWFFALEDAPIPTPAQDAQELLQLTGSENPYSIDYMYYSFLKRCSALERFSVPGNASPDQVTHCIRSPRKNLADLFCMLSTLGRLKELEIRGLKDYFSDVELMERQEQCEQIKWVLFT
ncbi:hypothetical protein BGZ59_000911 [Podila verticillata]|nr:hypothetical protein BGZ59_000911 [Podila verticillata]